MEVFMAEDIKKELEEMKNSEPSLYSKATGIANGILSRLKKAFDIHSPSNRFFVNRFLWFTFS